ncbi:MAG: hypothetical protein ABW071_11515 [Casimicrobiaceae bacterium]
MGKLEPACADGSRWRDDQHQSNLRDAGKRCGCEACTRSWIDNIPAFAPARAQRPVVIDEAAVVEVRAQLPACEAVTFVPGVIRAERRRFPTF